MGVTARGALFVALLAGLGACRFEPPGPNAFGDGGRIDAGLADAADAALGRDAEPPEGGLDDRDIAPDAGPPDAAPPLDGGALDAGSPDAAPPDAAPPDAGAPDAAPPDAGPAFACGDGVVDPTEACDDGNADPVDGCHRCQVTPGWRCELEPSRCVHARDVVEVRPHRPICATDGGGETGDPCTLEQALDRDPRPPMILVETATYAEALSIDGGGDTILYAPTGATLTHDAQVTLQVGGGARVVVAGFTIAGTAGGGGVKVEDAATELTLTQSTIGPSSELGIEVKSNAFLHLSRSRVVDNRDGGLKLDSDAGYAILSALVARNGRPGHGVGGVHVKKTSAAARFANVTVVDNESNQPAGIRCDVAASLVNVLVWGNVGSNATGISTDCRPRHGLFQAPVPGVQNISQDPLFADPEYRLGPGSPAVDAGDPLSLAPLGPALPLDLDGRRRPRGVAVDLGAYERP